MSWGLEDVGSSWKTSFDNAHVHGQTAFTLGYTRVHASSEKNRPPRHWMQTRKFGNLKTGILWNTTIIFNHPYQHHLSTEYLIIFAYICQPKLLEYMLYTATQGKYGL